jgi:hypothetical protein
MFCYVPTTCAAPSEGISVATTNSTNQDKQGRQYAPLISQFFLDVYGLVTQLFYILVGLECQ